MDSDFDAGRFRVLPDVRVDLSEYPALISPVYASTFNYHEMLREHVSELSELQQVFYTDNRYAVLLIFQAMDAAGKDSCIRHVMTGINPQGCSVHSFRHPSIEEYEHDFLWRSNAVLPERGHIGIFNRSYYEEVLIARVHPEIMESEGVAGVGIPTEEVWQGRYRSINDLERHLTANGTRVVKFFLHLSPEEQRKRFLKRIDRPEKNWKFSMADIEERRFWDEYMHAYASCLSETSSKDAPWYIVPADDKKTARLIVSSIILNLFRSFNLQYPKAGPERVKELKACRKLLSAKA